MAFSYTLNIPSRVVHLTLGLLIGDDNREEEGYGVFELLDLEERLHHLLRWRDCISHDKRFDCLSSFFLDGLHLIEPDRTFFWLLILREGESYLPCLMMGITERTDRTINRLLVSPSCLMGWRKHGQNWTFWSLNTSQYVLLTTQSKTTMIST